MNRIMLYHDYFAQTIPKHIDRESTALIKIFAYCQRQKYGPFKHMHKLVHFLQIVHQCQLRKNITRLLSKYLSTIVLHKSQTCLYGSKSNFCKRSKTFEGKVIDADENGHQRDIQLYSYCGGEDTLVSRTMPKKILLLEASGGHP